MNRWWTWTWRFSLRVKNLYQWRMWVLSVDMFLFWFGNSHATSVTLSETKPSSLHLLLDYFSYLRETCPWNFTCHTLDRKILHHLLSIKFMQNAPYQLVQEFFQQYVINKWLANLEAGFLRFAAVFCGRSVFGSGDRAERGSGKRTENNLEKALAIMTECWYVYGIQHPLSIRTWFLIMHWNV